MKVIESISELRSALATYRGQGKRVSFVPTMGNLHEGHLQLVRLAREHSDVVVASIFVNPLQFGLNEDWEQYPRTFEPDCEKLESAACDFLLYPKETEVYPTGMANQTRVSVPTMTDILCGASRPGHFEGVTTIVAKLFNMVQPDVAIFGIKDYQQLAVIRKMTTDLCLPIEIVAAPIARDHDGLALSSRNGYLDEYERPVAAEVYQSLCLAKGMLDEGRRDFGAIEQAAEAHLINSGMRIDYFSIRRNHDLEPAGLDDRNLVVLVAVYLGNTRLIDNIEISL
ncbi:pantoate--beta-alanine ligase [uncultured Umboniibacter sp.]|uniref:pantoate--beta-alanine ligase n=1 Tax=uncultured Umboniibacter sp. TaxID=1798917 RepID=UPI0026134D8A|nr:pantoate--beta-alanine ligase [uncultured Umboniibacter sp.]